MRWKEIEDFGEEEWISKAVLDDCEVCRGLRTIHVKRRAPRGKIDKVDGDDGLKPGDAEGQPDRTGASVN
jgi:hypothetical protein